ncbi:MAG TPA: nucleotidyl transferase AbiEii/AbiGii toxin family protein [Patescibacteria group bacterium]|nr:nucleotidyl transferase AbiEii/AbiGii toxin family protein [Patescibacteria group bacterium]
MVDNSRHRVKLLEILKDIYDDPQLRTALGFKGGTAAMLFYDLPRLSVDLDFDLLKEGREELVVDKLKKILANHGTLRETTKKRFTLFFLLSYELGERTIKVEISRRATESGFSPQTYLGIPMLVMNQEDMTAGKLSALITRRKPAMRDVFDTWFFLKNKWPVNDRVFQQKSGLSSLEAGLQIAIEHVAGIRKNQILQGLGELLDERQKSWVRGKLVKETVFQLKLLQESRR